MGKHTRLKPPEANGTSSKPGPRSSKPPTGAPPSDPQALLGRTCAHLERLLTSVEMALDVGDGSASLIRESASLARAITCMATERRALRKMELQYATRLERSAVVTYLRQLSPAERSRLVGEVERHESGVSVLTS